MLSQDHPNNKTQTFCSTNIQGVTQYSKLGLTLRTVNELRSMYKCNCVAYRERETIRTR